MRAKDVMTHDPKTCSPGQSLAAAAKTMWDHDCGCVPVVDDTGRVVGMLTDRDICMAAYTSGQPLHDLVASQAMSRNVVRCGPDDPIDALLAAMTRARVRRMPVIGRLGALIGVVSLTDVARAAEVTGWLRGVRMREVGRALAEIARRRNQPPNGMKTLKPAVTKMSLTR
jgi:CBS domain-containing protein